MSETNEFDKAPPLSAEQLRMTLLKQELEKVELEEKKRKVEEKKIADFTEDFLGGHVTNNEIALVRRLVMNAARDGKFEALVYSFPSDLCTDGGRAINSADPNWPKTLQGKAKEFYRRYQEFGKPQGYKLKAMIVNFPGGILGDVGLFISWEPTTD